MMTSLLVLQLLLWWYLPSSEFFRKRKINHISWGGFPWRIWSFCWFYVQAIWFGTILLFRDSGGSVQFAWFGIPYQSHSLPRFLFTSSYVPSAYNFCNAAVYKSSLVRGIGIYVNEDTTGLKNFHRVIFDSGAIIFISTWRSDFISSITPFPDIYFGVMSNGMIIECKENFECYFLS